MPILPTIPTTEAVVNALTAPVKKLLGFAAKNVMEPQGRPTKEVLTDLVKGDNPSFYKKQTVDGGNEIDTFLYNIPYSTENTSNVGPSYDEYLQKNFPTKKHNVKTYNAHFGDTLYIDQNYKRQVLDELEQGKTVGAHAGMYANAPSKIVSKNEEGRPYDAGGHLMQFSYDKDGNVVANMSDIYDFYPKDFKESYSRRAHGAITLGGLYALHHLGTPFIVRQNNIPVVFKDFNSMPSENLSSSQQKLKEYLNKLHLSSSSLSKPLSDEQIEEIFTGKNDSEIFDSMKQKGYFIFKKGGRIHIKKKNRGKFTESAKRAGMGVQEYARHVLANKDKYSSTLVKRANFARNAKKFKHENGGILKYQNPSGALPELIQRINKKSKANFVKRLLDPNRHSIQDWVAPLNIATHKLGWATEDTKQGAFVYPEIQEINGELVDFTHPSHRRSEGINSAIERRDTVRMTPEQAKWFTENYKEYYPGFKDGGNIHIKPENKGKFTDYCGGKVTQECIQRGKHSSDPTIRKRATFAANARKWKHAKGGIVSKYQDGGNFVYPYYWDNSYFKINTFNEGNKLKEEELYEKTVPEIPYRPIDYGYYPRWNIFAHGFENINQEIKDNSIDLYFGKKATYYKDKDNNYYRFNHTLDSGVINPENFKEVPYSEIRNKLASRDYIGGDKRDVGIKVIEKIPNLKDTIIKLSDLYNISKDVFTQRLINEGWLQQIAYNYNSVSPNDQKKFDWNNIMNDPVYGQSQLGLDTFGNYFKAGKLNLRRNINFEDVFGKNEDKTGREYNSANFKNAYDALEAKAAMLEYLTQLGKKKGLSGSDLDYWVNAAYNMGEYHKDLNNLDYVRKRYGFKPYYKLGGILKIR